MLQLEETPKAKRREYQNQTKQNQTDKIRDSIAKIVDKKNPSNFVFGFDELKKTFRCFMIQGVEI